MPDTPHGFIRVRHAALPDGAPWDLVSLADVYRITAGTVEGYGAGKGSTLRLRPEPTSIFRTDVAPVDVARMVAADRLVIALARGPRGTDALEAAAGGVAEEHPLNRPGVLTCLVCGAKLKFGEYQECRGVHRLPYPKEPAGETAARDADAEAATRIADTFTGALRGNGAGESQDHRGGADRIICGECDYSYAMELEACPHCGHPAELGGAP